MSVALVSDYRSRGISFSKGRAALQGGIDVTSANGWFLGTSGSTIANYGGSIFEIDLYGGRAGQVAGINYTITTYGYVYPGGRGVSYGEVQGSLSRRYGAISIGIEAALSPHQRHTAAQNIYAGVSASAAIPATPLTLTLRGGYEDGFYDRKRDWEVRFGYEGVRLSISAALVGTDRATRRAMGRTADNGLIVSAASTF